jgi:serine O-acetyltransferase
MTHQGGPVGQVIAVLMGLVYRPEATLFLRTAEIGPGLFIQHGFATSVDARRIGANCWINQQVTIGYDSFLRAPELEDGVVVSTGAIVLGSVHLGRGAHVGAGAVVTHDVPAGMVAVGVPARNREPGANARAHGPQAATGSEYRRLPD